MRYMLDTNVCIHAIKKKSRTVIANILRHDPDELCISAITYAELMHGVEKSQEPKRNRIALTLFLSPITILEFDSYAAEEYGKVRAELEKNGTPIGPMDTLIAGECPKEDLKEIKEGERNRRGMIAGAV